jgi:hypothetical protein
VMSRSLKKALQRMRRHAIKSLDEARNCRHGDVYVKHWATALLFTTTDTDDPLELQARLECYLEEMDAILACVEAEAAEAVA